MNKTSLNDKICPYCDPIAVHPSHLSDRFNKLIQYALNPIDSFLHHYLPTLHNLFDGFTPSDLIKIFFLMGLLKEHEISEDDGGIYNRTLVLVREAHKKNLSVKVLKFFGKNTNFFSITVNGNKHFFEGLPTFGSDKIPEIDSSDKYKFKETLKENKLPYAEGEVFRNYADAKVFVEKFGFPVVVKPRSGSLSKHTTCDIQDYGTLKKAIKAVKIISSEFIVERFIKGGVYRITVVGNKVEACCLREPPNVVGDGVHTIKELIEMKNADPRRGESHQKNFSLHKIPLTPKVVSFISERGFNVRDALPKNVKIYLHSKVILAGGADIHDKTDEICEENKVLSQRVSQIFRAPLMGIDFICQDISRPYYSQECATIEGNNLPYIDMHHYPVTGKERNVALSILNAFLRKHNQNQTK